MQNMGALLQQAQMMQKKFIKVLKNHRNISKLFEHIGNYLIFYKIIIKIIEND